jgi:hypothetical protein
MLKGSGKILVSLVDTVLDQGARNRRIHFDTSVTASGAWTRVEIPVAGLRVTEDALGMENGKRWDEPVHSLKIIRFMATSSLSGAGDTVDITLDDIRLEGVNLRDFIH